MAWVVMTGIPPNRDTKRFNSAAPVEEDVLAVYGMIAEAESHAHGVPVTEIHFHEVGTMDAVAADIFSRCASFMNELMTAIFMRIAPFYR